MINLDDIRAQYGDGFVEDFGVKFLTKDDYYNTAIPHSQFVMGNNQAYYKDGEITGRTYCANGSDFCRVPEEIDGFYDNVFADWRPSGFSPISPFDNGKDIALRYTIAMSPNLDANGNKIEGGWNNVSYYNPGDGKVNIVDLDAYMTTMRGAGINVNGSTAIGVTYSNPVTGRSYRGEEAWNRIWHYERNYFNGEAPSLAEIQKRNDYIEMSDRLSQYHCEGQSDCHKFVNPQTGQEFVYINGEVVYDVSLMGTYNYAEADGMTRWIQGKFDDPGNSSSQHYWRDIYPYAEDFCIAGVCTPWSELGWGNSHNNGLN